MIWRSIQSFTVISKSCIFKVNMNLNKTFLQSIYMPGFFFLQQQYFIETLLKTGLAKIRTHSTAWQLNTIKFV